MQFDIIYEIFIHVHTLHLFWSLSPIRHGFAPGFVNYKKVCTQLATASDQVYQLLIHGRCFSPGTPASSNAKTCCHDIVESGVKTPKIKSFLKMSTIHCVLTPVCCFLLQRDSTIAKLLFGEVFKAIFNKMDEVKAEREIQSSIQQINTSIDTILSSSTNYFPPFISCVLVSFLFLAVMIQMLEF